MLTRTIVVVLAGLILLGITRLTPAPRAPLTVAILDLTLTDVDIAQMTVLMIDGSGFLYKAITKSRSEMPASSRYWYYAGKDARGIPITWRTDEALPRQGKARSEETRESDAVAVIAVLDAPSTQIHLRIREGQSLRSSIPFMPRRQEISRS